MKLNLISIVSVVLLISGFNAFAGGVPDSNFSTPEKTIETYYNSYGNRDILSQCFYPPGFTGSMDKFWSKYQIIDKKKTSKAGESIYSGVIVSKDAVEIIVELEIESSENKQGITKFWYLLQEIDREWKIIEHSHVSDELYPAYD